MTTQDQAQARYNCALPDRFDFVVLIPDNQ